MKKNGALIPLVVGLLFSGIFSVIGFYYLTTTMDLNENGIHAEATVIEMVSRRDSDGDNIYYPVVEFRLVNGELETEEMSFGSSPPSYNVGDVVDLAYYEGDLSSAAIISTFSMYIFPGIFIGIGTIIQFILLIIIINVSRKRKKNKGFGSGLSNTRSYLDSNNDEEEHNSYDKSSDKDNKNPFIVDE